MKSRKKNRNASQVQAALRALLGDQTTRESNLKVLEQASPRGKDREFARVSLHLQLFGAEIRACMKRIQEGGRYSFDQLRSDSPAAHRKAAAIQDLLGWLGYYLGPTPARTRGNYGGPPGKPVALPLREVSALVARASRTDKLLDLGNFGNDESWTRDAVRRLQGFCGSTGRPPVVPPTGGNCLVRPDGLFGNRTLQGLREALSRVESGR